MNTKSLLLGVSLLLFGISTAQAQINFGERALGAVQKGMTGLTFTDTDAAALSKPAVDKMDTENKVAGPTDPYAIRLDKVFGKYTKGEFYTLNYKVYLTKDINAFATADGSVRVFSGLMDMMDDNELIAVIGHEIGHVNNHDSRDAMKALYQKEALIDAAASQSNKVAAITDSQLAKIGSAMIDSKHSRTQESEADLFAYDFMKKNGYNVNAEESAFRILAKMSQGAQSTIIDQMMSSHPDSNQRADDAKARAEKDGLYKPYVQQKPAAKKTTTAKKTTAKKK
ncbi:M48 family metalloprotease [Flavobacterium sp. ZT3R18]|uniref:M48 family metalloprotease n=1 Tax=Flavobacterium sp. ZT3R18 TaxID=2594429 RepID=UPI00117BB83A|nr:M48 family metalloprotease [Flavobacterium sp. ZT3R18]TRX36552.1 M48 family metalloprotease [Flavobacterium sp. ZT3R18]